MKKNKIRLPSGHDATLVYFAKSPEARSCAIWWLQLRKMGIASEMHAAAYSRELPNLTKSFAKSLLDADDIAPDLVLIPASATKQFQPYVNAIVAAQPEFPVVEGMFSKPNGFKAGDTGQTYERVLDATKLDATKLPHTAKTVKRIWIIDDIFNTGNTMGAMMARLDGHLPAIVEIFVVCQLYVPLEATPAWTGSADFL